MKKQFEREEKKLLEKMLSSYFSNIRRTQFNQSSPVQPVSDFMGGYPEPDGQTEEIPVSDIGLSNFQYIRTLKGASQGARSHTQEMSGRDIN